MITGYKKVTQHDNSGNQGLRSVLQTGGTIAGGIIGGMAGGVGAAPGAAIGGAMGGALGGVVAPDKPTEVKEGKMMQESQGGDGAMQRRMEQMNNDPGVQIADANAAIAKMPPDVQQEYGPTLAQAQKLSMRRV